MAAGAAGHQVKCGSVAAGPGATALSSGDHRHRVPAGPASATAVSSTHPTCQEGDAAGFILLIDTFLSHCTLCLLSLTPLSSPFFEENPSPAPGERKGEKPHKEQ